MAKKDDIEVQARMKQKKWNSEEGGSGQLLIFKFTKSSSRKFRNQRGGFCRRFQNEFVLKEIYVLHLKETSSLYQKEQPH
jgi:hypothetical protein